MRVFRSFEAAAVIRNPVVTTGSFDGVHVGHKTILARLAMLAEKVGGESVLITFDPHPRKVLYPESAGKDLKLINSQEEKLELLERAGLQNVIIIEFTMEFSRITSEEFVRDLLCGTLGAKVIVAGFNHHFGFNQEGDYRRLWEWREKYGFEAEEIPEQEVQHETVSSTRIRQAISEGYIQRANAYLDHYYIVKAVVGPEFVSAIAGMPRLFSIPITEESKLLPAPGVYAVSVGTSSGAEKGLAITCRSGNPGGKVLLNMLDDADIEGTKVTVSFHKKIFGAVDPCEEKHFQRIINARNEIDELIY
ncbi:MAG: adenylyltransferase/cytidyltransferase family protein [Bacteroidales bacterium]|jgi:riboflavin kinase/FMN adenylyltransferase|nr:adenylyltransferase/cytidyltransferase family protein [Bacteroidales bacterium]